jgi:hypothetical protein
MRALGRFLWLVSPIIGYELGRRDGERWGRVMGQLSATAEMTRALAERERSRSAAPPARPRWRRSSSGWRFER